ncbi:MAG: hypothetical protein LC768_03010 [Acidobacteria bacterium]|nr:hypothetical protein [Acidobacteriota bacterium]MCA1637302.1 hypothetical protein [Acidobacteriota bacterium]
MKNAKFILFLILISAGFVQAQTNNKKVPLANNQAAKFSPAYSEVLLRKTERESELEEFLIDYTEEFPKVKEIRFELGLLQKEMGKVLAVNSSEAGKLTLALGKLLVRKTELETDLWNLRRQYNDEHPEVKRAKRKIEVFEKAIKEILP